MIWSGVKNLFNTSWDSYASGQLEDPQLNDIFTKSTIIVLKKLYNELDFDNSITTELSPLIIEDTPAQVGGVVNLDAQLNSFERLINVEVSYTGTPYGDITKVAQPIVDAEAMSQYSKGTYRYPRYRYFADIANSESSIKIFPPTNISAVNIRYFRDYYPYEFGNVVWEATDCMYGNRTVQMIVDEALKQAAATFREQPYFTMENTTQQQANQPL